MPAHASKFPPKRIFQVSYKPSSAVVNSTRTTKTTKTTKKTPSRYCSPKHCLFQNCLSTLITWWLILAITGQRGLICSGRAVTYSWDRSIVYPREREKERAYLQFPGVLHMLHRTRPSSMYSPMRDNGTIFVAD